ncbi:MAG: right-handed parallel beta-helix repeat-containing protein, partial [Longimicrobiales bacterium]
MLAKSIALAVVVLVAQSNLVHAQTSRGPAVRLERGMVITKSVRIAPGSYRLGAPASMDSAVITIRGNDLEVDFAGSVLRGVPEGSDPDMAAGVGIRIEGGTNVRVINARVHGYKVGLLARGTLGLKLIDNDFSHNWKPRLMSVVEHESLNDWLSHHKNESDEWLRFGAGAYLADIHGGEIRGNVIEQGMEGLMLVRSDSLLVWNNAIEYNSGVGIGMYRSSDNRIMHNHASFNVRGFSRYYRRGQDSADLLMYEQSSRNIVAFNQMTHGGDGLFLWAGQSTMDTGVGGANDNLFFDNDFSYAPTNAMEATFSRNTFVRNVAKGSDYGLWGGYSFDSKIIDNDFTGNRTGVAIEHGQNNVITDNRFNADTVALYLWGNPIEPSEWGYPKHRDTRSRDYEIARNTFRTSRVALRINGTTGASVTGNRFIWVDSLLVVRDSSKVGMTGNDTSELRATSVGDGLAHRGGPEIPGMPAPLPSGLSHRRSVTAGPVVRNTAPAAPRNAIIVDEWGPYSWKYPRLWPVDSTRANPLRLLVLGPAGRWRVVSRDGVQSVSRTEGAIHSADIVFNPLAVRDTIAVVPAAGGERDWRIELEYVGGETISPRGAKLAVGKPYRFTWSHFEPIAHWDVAFHIWGDSTDPRSKAEAFTALLKSTPLMTRSEPRLDYMWYGPAIKGIPPSKWAAVATSTVTLSAGHYTLRSISDDAARVYVDGDLVIDDWAPHESKVSSVPIAAGRHDIRVEYYQLDG